MVKLFIYACVTIFTLSFIHSFSYFGHEIIVSIASKLLSQSAVSATKNLLPPKYSALKFAANWADSVKNSTEYSWTESLHYINTNDYAPYNCTENFVAVGSNVVSAVANYTNILNDPFKEHEIKSEALLLIIHLVADLHQPLHGNSQHDV